MTEDEQFYQKAVAMNEALLLGSIRQHESTEATERLNAQLQVEIAEGKRVEEERKKLDQRLRDQQFYTRSLIESNVDALVTTDPLGIITDVNKQMETLTGCTRDELIGAPFKNYFTDPKRAEAGIKQMLSGKRITDYELTARSRDGERTIVSCNATTFYDRNRKLQGMFAAARDITERKRIERALQETNIELERVRDKMVAASRAKDDFLAALSHELRTPLTPVLLLAGEAADDPAMSEQARQIFAMIVKNVKLEARLIDDLLDITRITNGKLALDLQVVDIHVALKNAIETVRSELEEKQIALKLNLVAGKLFMMGDPVRLQQIFWNVLRNAVKFTPSGGEIIIETLILPGGIMSMKIVDTGIGMTEQELGRIFTAFAQGDHASAVGSHRFGGLGLGLTISRMLTELHSGTIRAESKGLNQGSTFFIEFPANKEEPLHSSGLSARSLAAPTSEKNLRSVRILLVEDHEATRTALTQLLIRRHYEVVPVASVAEARIAAKGADFDLLVSDIGLPDGSGHELMADLHARYGLKGIALTGYGQEEDLARAREAGFVTHLTKPVSIQSLEHALAVAASANEG